jgi:hypothetical protein
MDMGMGMESDVSVDMDVGVDTEHGTWDMRRGHVQKEAIKRLNLVV